MDMPTIPLLLNRRKYNFNKMKFVIVFLHLLDGNVAQATFSATYPLWNMPTCSQMLEKVTYFEENPKYKAGNGETWIHRKYKDKIVILSAIDNLIKGGSGQGVQNMNIIFNFPESRGLI